MELFSQKVKREELNPGDHIYTWRKQIYNHHGIFIGEGKIIHFVNVKTDKLLHFSTPLGSSSGGGGKKISCPNWYCGTEKVAGSGVRMSCIDCFIKKGSLYLFKYNVSRGFLVLKNRGGTCTTARSDPSEEVIRRAKYLYENGYEGYDLINNNCEDFALYCKTGLWSKDKQQGRSSQANMVRRTREYNDLGMRQDVVKIAVEDLSSYVRTLK